jgi:glucosamine--fructose-6-phosphate aminotransferase (isomerizing)
VIVVTNYEGRPLSNLGDINLVIPGGQEQSVAQTRSFASMYVTCVGLIHVLAGKPEVLDAMIRLPELGTQLISRFENLSKQWGEDLSLDRFYFLGSGLRYGLACEVNLKMKEMSLTHSEPFHFLEFRHGPISMVGPNTLVVGLLSDRHFQLERAVLADAQKLGSHLYTLGEEGADVEFLSGLPDSARNVLYLPALQLMGYYRSCAKGLNPDRPNNITAVVKLNW